MATQKDIINAYADRWIRNYAVEAFHDMHLNTLIHMLTDWVAAGGTAGPVTNVAGTWKRTSADFINATDCPIAELNGESLAVFWNDTPRYLIKGVDWQDLVGGGFTILIPGFDSTAATFTFFITIQTS